MTLTRAVTAARSRRVLPVRWLAAAALGLVIGTATSFGQQYLPDGWNALVNAASPWLAAAFAAGALQRRTAAAMLAGPLACLAEVAAYYVVTPLRGHPVATSEIAFWSMCALVGGPLLGWAGTRWWRSCGRARVLGAALLPATFLAEAVGSYALTLRYWDSAILFVVLGLAALAVVLLLAPAEVAEVPVWPTIGWTLALTALGVGLYGPVLGSLTRAWFAGG